MKKGDIFLIAIVLCLAAFGFFFIGSRGKGQGGTLTVYIDGEVYDVYDMSKDQEIILEGEDWHNKFQIKDGIVTMMEADCPDQYCVKHAPIDKESETIVCLPHKGVLEITEGEQQREVDA